MTTANKRATRNQVYRAVCNAHRETLRGFLADFVDADLTAMPDWQLRRTAVGMFLDGIADRNVDLATVEAICAEVPS